MNLYRIRKSFIGNQRTCNLNKKENLVLWTVEKIQNVHTHKNIYRQKL